jgi:hypothetical protein
MITIGRRKLEQLQDRHELLPHLRNIDLSRENDSRLMCTTDHLMCTEVLTPKGVYCDPTNSSLHPSLHHK